MAVKKEIVIKVNTDLGQTTQELDSFNTEAQSTVKTINSLEDSIDQLNAQLKSTEVGSAQYEELRLQLRGAKTELEGLEGGFEAIQIHDRVDSVVKFGEAAVGAFGLASAGLQAFGANSEEIEKIEKTLLTTITAMASLRAVSEAFSSENLKRFKALRESIAATAATTRAAAATMKTALISTGIGILVLAVGALAANWDAVTGAVKRYITSSKEAKALEKERVEAVKELTKSVGDLSLELELLEARGLPDEFLNTKRLKLAEKEFELILADNVNAVNEFYDNLAAAGEDAQLLKSLEESGQGSQFVINRLKKSIKETEDILTVAGDDAKKKLLEYKDKVLSGTLTDAEAQNFRDILLPILGDEELSKFEDSLVKIQTIITKSAENRSATTRSENQKRAEIELAQTRRLNDNIYNEQVRADADQITLLQTKGAGLKSELEKTQAELEKVDVFGGDQDYAVKLGEQAYNLKQQILDNEYDIAKTREEIRNEEIAAEKKAAEDKKAIDEKAAADELKRLQDLENSKRALYQEDFDNFVDANAHKLDILSAQGADTISILQTRNAQILDEEKKIQSEVSRLGDSDLERKKALNNQILQLEQEKAVNIINIGNETAAQQQEQFSQNVEMITAVADATLQAVNMIADEMARRSDERIEALNEQLSLASSNYDEAVSNIQNLESQLANARGKQRKDLLKQIEAEKRAEKKAAAQKIKLEKQIADEEYKAAKQQYAINLTNAAVQGGLAVLNALNFAPPASFIFAGLAGALAAIQIGIIASNPPKKAAEGMLIGPSHSDGGIGVNTPGGMIEAEGGEIIINKKSSSLFRDQLSDINSYNGYGKKFAAGGELDSTGINNISNATTDFATPIIDAIQNMKIYTSIQEVREADTNFTSIEETAEL